MASWWNGIHRRLKISRPYGLVGSSPTEATILRRENEKDRQGFYIFSFCLFWRQLGCRQSKDDQESTASHEQVCETWKKGY